MRRLVLLLPVVFAGCASGPDSYPIPPQHPPVRGPEIHSFGDYVRSSQPDAESYFVRDITAVEGGAWRWTHAEPEFRFQLSHTENRRFKLVAGVNDVTFRDMGPLRLSIVINDQEFDRVVYDSPGDKTYEKPVPPELLRNDAENRVIVRVLNPWKTDDPKVKLGFILFEAGFL